MEAATVYHINLHLRLEEVIEHLNYTVEPRVANNTGSIDFLRHRVESIEGSVLSDTL